MFTDIMGIVIDTEDKWLNKKLNSHICYKGGVSGIDSAGMFQQEVSEGPTEVTSTSSSSSGLEQGSSKVAEARTKLEGALGSLQGLKDGSSGVCSCGKPKGKCNCKGYKDGTPHTMGSLLNKGIGMIMDNARAFAKSRGYADGTRSIDELMKEYREKMNAPTENTEKLRSMIREKQKKGYAYGTKMISPMGYYMGDAAVATPQQEQEMMAMAPGVRMEAAGPTADFGQPSELTQAAAATTQKAVKEGVEGQIADPIAKKIAGSVIEDGRQALTQKAIEAGTEKATQEVAKAGTQELAKAGVEAAGGKLAGAKAGALAGAASGLSSGIAGGVGSLAGDIVSGKGITKEGAGKALLQAGLTATMGPIGGMIGGLFKDGTPSVPPMGYTYGTPKVKEKEKDKFEAKRPVIVSAPKAQQQGGMSLEGMAEQGLLGFIPKLIADKDFREDTVDFAEKGGLAGALFGFADGTAKMTPEEYQMKFIKERIVEPAEAYVEERPMLQAPLLMASAARDYERGKLPLGKFGGGKLEGGKDRLVYRHKKYGDFEVNPESERVSYKKTFRF